MVLREPHGQRWVWDMESRTLTVDETPVETSLAPVCNPTLTPIPTETPVETPTETPTPGG